MHATLFTVLAVVDSVYKQTDWMLDFFLLIAGFQTSFLETSVCLLSCAYFSLILPHTRAQTHLLLPLKS